MIGQLRLTPSDIVQMQGLRGFLNRIASLAILFLVQMTACTTDIDHATETAAITAVIDDHIGWFANKDFDLLFNTMTNGTDLFMFQLDTASTIRGFDQFQEYSVRWQNPDVHYARHDTRDLQITLSPQGGAAWFATVLTDCAVVRGSGRCFTSRWTGVLEKRDGRWLFVQEHFSLPVEPAELRSKATPLEPR